MDTSDCKSNTQRNVIVHRQTTERYIICFFLFSLDDSLEDTSSMTAAELLAGADILMASVGELRREIQESEPAANANSNDAVQSRVDRGTNAPIVVDADTPIDMTEDPRIILNDISTRASTSRSNISSSNSSLDDSVVIIGGAAQLGQIKPIGQNQDEDVIFVTEKRQPYRTIATIDLCESFDSPQKTAAAAAAAQSSSDDDQPTTKKVCTNNNNTTPQKSTIGTTKCPICLEMFTMDRILSTMCGHLYCAPCIQGVVKTRKKCPMCNRGLKQNQLHRIYIDANM